MVRIKFHPSTQSAYSLKLSCPATTFCIKHEMGQQGQALAENAKNISEYYCERTYELEGCHMFVHPQLNR